MGLRPPQSLDISTAGGSVRSLPQRRLEAGWLGWT